MEDTALVKVFKRLSQGSKQSVQSGQELDDFDRYMHVDRPIDKAVRAAMDEIRQEGGGVLFLVGSAGDGKSHMISTLKEEYADFDYRNDASESPWPTVKSIDALKIFLSEFKDATLSSTHSKMLVAINMGKLNAFIDDAEVLSEFAAIVNKTKTLFKEGNFCTEENARVKVVSFANHQIFELFPDQDMEYPVDSLFIRQVLAKITSTKPGNIFYDAFRSSMPIGSDFDPCYVNYQLLCCPAVQDSIVKIIIEAIVRFKLMLTPREFFDFVYRLIVPSNYATFTLNNDFFSSLLPNILFAGGENKILRCMALLDPLKHGSIKHNDMLSELFASMELPDETCFNDLKSVLHPRFFEILGEYYQNNRKNVEDISRLLFRMKHLLRYHSESDAYRSFLKILCGYYENDEERLFPLYETIQRCIPHFYGSYTDKQNLVPLDIQGREYKFFASCENLMPFPLLDVKFDLNNRNKFVVEIDTRWKVHSSLSLKIEFLLYEYLCKIQQGKLAQADDRNHNLSFCKFISNLVRETNYQEKLVILTANNQMLTLSKNFGNKITLK